MSKEKIFGEIDWNSGDVSDGNAKSDFMRLEQGKTRVRIMGDPTQYYIHWVENAEGKKRKFNSPIGDPKLVKQLEEAGFKRKASWMIKVLSRVDGEFKLLEIGSQFYTGVRELLQDSEWGKPITSYDVTITRGAPGSQPLYRVTPCPKAPLEASLKEAFVAFNDRVDLTKLTQPGDPEKIREFMGWTVSKTASASPEVEETEDDFFNFEGDE